MFLRKGEFLHFFDFINRNIRQKFIKFRSGKWLNVVNEVSSGVKNEITGIALAWLPIHNSCILYCMTVTNVKSYVINKTVINEVNTF